MEGATSSSSCLTCVWSRPPICVWPRLTPAVRVPAGDHPVRDALVRGVRVPRDDDLVAARVVARLRAHPGRSRRRIACDLRRRLVVQTPCPTTVMRAGVRVRTDAVLVLRG